VQLFDSLQHYKMKEKVVVKKAVTYFQFAEISIVFCFDLLLHQVAK